MLLVTEIYECLACNMLLIIRVRAIYKGIAHGVMRLRTFCTEKCFAYGS